MKVDIISDIHMDFYIKETDTNKPKFKKHIEDFVKNILCAKDGEILIIAGDTSHYNEQTKALLQELKKYYKNIFIVFGNHSLYLVSKSQSEKYNYKSTNRLNELKDMCKDIGVHFLDGNVVEICGLRFGGTGSWYDLSEDDLDNWDKTMNDSRLIKDGKGHYVYSMYGSGSYSNTFNPIEFYKKEKKKLLKIAKEGCDVFITHMALHEPTEDEGMCSEFLDDKNNIFYYTNNEDILEKSCCKVHIFGHTHKQFDFKMNDIRMVCNPLGYPSENSYCTIKTIDIGD